MRDREEYTVSTSHVGLRTAGLIVAVAVAVAAFYIGFTRLGHKAPGYYEIQPDASEEAPLYRNGFTLIYYFDAPSDEIKLEMDRLKDVYGAALLYSYKLLDTEHVYEGIVNIAALNDRLGEETEVSEELADILSDLWKKTEEGKGVNLFAGSLLREWVSILALDDISDFDPGVRPDVAERLERLAAETSKKEHFSVSVSEDSGKVKLAASEEYLAFLRRNEYSTKILTAGRLEDAYRLALIKNTLESMGFTNGYLYTDSGLTLSLSGHEAGKYVLYGYDDGKVISGAELEAGANSACSFLRTFPMEDGELMYHAAESPAGEKFYHPYFVMDTGKFADILASSCAVRYDGDIVAACYENIALYNVTDRAAIEAVLSEDTVAAVLFADEPDRAVYFHKKPSGQQ